MKAKDEQNSWEQNERREEPQGGADYQNYQDYQNQQNRQNQQNQPRGRARRTANGYGFDDLGDFVNSGVRFGTSVGGMVLSSIAEALDSVQDSFHKYGNKQGSKQEAPATLAQVCRRLDRQLN
ncbi:MAG: hypothetical protein PHO10_10305, partial [Gemmiger sp.]|nr:hypothetical protein [Gemmiger sp.]